MQGSNDTYTVTQDRQQPGLAQRVGYQKQTAPSDAIRWAHLASIHQMAPPKRGGTHHVSFATHLSTTERWKAELT